MNLPKIPLAEWIEWIEDWLKLNFDPVFKFIKSTIEGMVNGLEFVLLGVPALALIVIFAAIAWYLGKWRMGVFTLIGLLIIHNLGLWDKTMLTLALVLTATIISVVFGVPIGILAARSDRLQKIIQPVLDFMQTMPAFVYLLPTVTFFSLGVVPGVISSIIFAIPPTIRLTNLGIRQVPSELIEAADAFGSTPGQKLFKLQLPLAVPDYGRY